MSAAGSIDEMEDRLVRPAEAGWFSETELEGLPLPARRHLAQAIAPGTPLAQTARLRMHGTIKLGGWLPFRAREVLTPLEGFVWAARVAGFVSGWDHYAGGAGAMDWKLAGLVPLVHGEGPDVSRSAAGRAGAEALWVPTALLPRFGVQWTADDEHHVAAHYRIGDLPLDVHYELNDDYRVLSLVLDRWGDPDRTGAWGWHPFGVEVTRHRTFGGVTIPSAGQAGWFFGTDRWPDGAFLRYEISDLELVKSAAGTTPSAEPSGTRHTPTTGDGA